tara:strand:+ start:1585 stop:2049 length:465 start_codon:yes stop_codon:yes gene_type:complete
MWELFICDDYEEIKIVLTKIPITKKYWRKFIINIQGNSSDDQADGRYNYFDTKAEALSYCSYALTHNYQPHIQNQYNAKKIDILFLQERNYDTEEGFSEDKHIAMLNISYRHIKPLQKTTIVTEQLSELGLPTGVLIESEVFKLKACISLIHHK